jgi:tRNA nucleotidyltransferase (CCA-adding enzyme)
LTKKLAIKFRDEPLVFIDPVDKARNVASAVSRENLNMFRKAAEKYLENPHPEFFFPNTIKPLNKSQLNKLLKSYPNTILGLMFSTPKIVPDILHGQLRKSVRVVQRFLDSEGFGVVHAKYFCDDQTILLFELESGKLADVETHVGPPGGHKNVKDFLAKWRSNKSAISKPYLKDQRWYVDIKREFTTPVKLLEANILKLSLGKHVLKAVQAEVRINQDLDLVEKGLEGQLSLFLTRKYPWEY